MRRLRFGIKWKLTLAFALLVILPALAAQLVTRYAVVGRFSQEFEARVDAVTEQVRAEYSRVGEELAGRISGLFEGTEQDTNALDKYLAELRQGELSTNNILELNKAFPSIIRAAGIDFFELIDKKGSIITYTPLGGKLGHKDLEALALAKAAPHKPLLFWGRLPAQSGGAEERLLLVVAIEVTRYGAPLYAIGGRLITDEFLYSLTGQSQASLGLAKGEQTLFGAGVVGVEALPHRQIVLSGAEEGVVKESLYRIVVSVSDRNLREAIEDLTLLTGIVLGGGVLAAWVLGFIIARRFTTPIDDLGRRAHEVAAGDLKSEIPKSRNDEIGDLIDSFNEMTRRLAESQERLKHAERVAAWQEIARRLAHEIKNPLFPIQMSVETLRKTFDRKDFKEIFEESTTAVLEEVERLKKIVSEFSQFARLPEPKFTPVSLKEVLSAAVRLCAAANEESNIKVEARYEDLPSIPADREQLTQVFLNLLSNAREAMPQGGTIKVDLRRVGAEASLSVSDTGMGISEEAKEKIFTPYFTTKEKGTGLGLAIAHRIIKGHNGRISVDGKEGQGATFTLFFPLGE